MLEKLNARYSMNSQLLGCLIRSIVIIAAHQQYALVKPKLLENLVSIMI
jgi:hypothetical protein